LFYAAVDGNNAALEESQRLLDELGGENSINAEVVAYSGALDLLSASRSPLIWEKVSLARRGLELQDRAVAMAPQNLEVRFLRGVTNYQIPFFLGRHQLALDDLAAVAQVAEAAADDGQLDRRAAATALFYHANELARLGQTPDAIAQWQAAVRVDPNSAAGRDAIKRLRAHKINVGD
jgi:tetratricopeptide (TPR) repeat protein